MTISSQSKAAGLSVFFALDPAERYLLRFEGTDQGENQTFLRLRENGGDFHYQPAADALEHLLVEVSKLEVLVYGEEAFSHRIETLQLERCPACKTDEDLRQLILSEIPELANDAIQPLDAALLMLDWAARVTDYAVSPLLLEKNLTRRSAADIYYGVFETSSGGVYCGGASVFLDKVLKLFGYGSFTLNFGRTGYYTHVAVILPVQSGASWHYYLLDPTFNATFHDKDDGRLATVSDMLESAKGSGPAVTILNRSLLDRDFLFLPTQRPSCPELREARSDLLICSRPTFGMASSFESSPAGDDYRDSVTTYLGLLGERVFSAGKATNPAARREFLRLLEREGVPYGRPDG